MNLQSVDSLKITLVVENFIDMLLTDTPQVSRVGLYQHFKPDREAILAENGLAYLIDVTLGKSRQTVLFDTGLTSLPLLHNFEALGRSVDEVTHVVISHGHPDHYGGLVDFLRARKHPVPVAIHPDAFLPRYVRLANGGVIPLYNHGLDREAIEAAGGKIVLTKSPLLLAPGLSTTGEIPAVVDFEPPMSEEGKGGTLLCLRDGVVEEDMTVDDLALMVHVRDKGLVVITGCAHAGVISSIRRAQEVSGIERVHAVIGGFHLGFPGIPKTNADKTVEALQALEPSLVCPIHCSGIHAIHRVYGEMPEAFVQGTAGMVITM